MKKKARATPKPKKSQAPQIGPEPSGVLFKVVELSNVDESAIEEVINTWTSRGWDFDGMQFAMRESSKRPAMAFIFFNRRATQAEIDAHVAPRTAEEAERHLMRLAKVPAPTAPPVSAYERLIQLAEGGDEE